MWTEPMQCRVRKKEQNNRENTERCEKNCPWRMMLLNFFFPECIRIAAQIIVEPMCIKQCSEKWTKTDAVCEKTLFQEAQSIFPS